MKNVLLTDFLDYFWRQRPITNGPYGIYAYKLERISIERIYKHGDVSTLAVGS